MALIARVVPASAPPPQAPAAEPWQQPEGAPAWAPVAARASALAAAKYSARVASRSPAAVHAVWVQAVQLAPLAGKAKVQSGSQFYACRHAGLVVGLSLRCLLARPARRRAQLGSLRIGPNVAVVRMHRESTRTAQSASSIPTRVQRPVFRSAELLVRCHGNNSHCVVYLHAHDVNPNSRIYAVAAHRQSHLAASQTVTPRWPPSPDSAAGQRRIRSTPGNQAAMPATPSVSRAIRASSDNCCCADSA